MITKTDIVVEEFFKTWPSRHYSKGEIMIWAGYSPEYIYYIKQGQVKQYGMFSGGKKLTLNVYKPKAFFPMAWAINRQKNNFYFEAASEVEVFCCPADQALRFVVDNPDILLDLTSRLYAGMDGVLQKMAYSMLKDAYKIVVNELVTEYRRTQKRTSNYSGLVALNEEELASHVGLARETVNRQLAKLKRAKLITRVHGGIIINDIKGLQGLLIARD